MNIPNDKNCPEDAIQCNDCCGHGCDTCENKGWLPKDHPKGRRCGFEICNNPIPPAQVVGYCSRSCANVARFG